MQRANGHYKYITPDHQATLRSEEDAYYWGMKHNLPFGGRAGSTTTVKAYNAARARHRRESPREHRGGSGSSNGSNSAGSTSTSTSTSSGDDDSGSSRNSSSVNTSCSSSGDIDSDNDDDDDDDDDDDSAAIDETSVGLAMASLKSHLRSLSPTTPNNYVKRVVAAAVARSPLSLRQLAKLTGLHRTLLAGERNHQASGATSCTLAAPSRALRSDRYSDLMIFEAWKLLHDDRISKVDNTHRKPVVVMRPDGDGSADFLEPHPYRELDGTGTYDHLYNKIRGMEEWKTIRKLQDLHNQELKKENPDRTMFLDVDKNPKMLLRRAMCRCVCLRVCVCGRRGG